MINYPELSVKVHKMCSEFYFLGLLTMSVPKSAVKIKKLLWPNLN